MCTNLLIIGETTKYLQQNTIKAEDTLLSLGLFLVYKVNRLPSFRCGYRGFLV